MFPRIDYRAAESAVYRFVRPSLWSDEHADVATALPSAQAARLTVIVTDAVRTIEQALDTYGVALSFNGGKDCTVIIYLLVAVLARYESRVSHDPLRRLDLSAFRIPTIYIAPDHPFPEINDFVIKCAHRYHCDLTATSGHMKSSLTTFVQQNPSISAIFLGIRRTDPFSDSLKPFIPCDPGWPTLMRINPILDWNYSDIWLFLYTLNVEYSVLYDRGYTSLGSADNTILNPALRTENDQYLPAWQLQDATKERESRVQSVTRATTALKSSTSTPDPSRGKQPINKRQWEANMTKKPSLEDDIFHQQENLKSTALADAFIKHQINVKKTSSLPNIKSNLIEPIQPSQSTHSDIHPFTVNSLTALLSDRQLDPTISVDDLAKRYHISTSDVSALIKHINTYSLSTTETSQRIDRVIGKWI